MAPPLRSIAVRRRIHCSSLFSHYILTGCMSTRWYWSCLVSMVTSWLDRGRHVNLRENQTCREQQFFLYIHPPSWMWRTFIKYEQPKSLLCKTHPVYFAITAKPPLGFLSFYRNILRTPHTKVLEQKRRREAIEHNILYNMKKIQRKIYKVRGNVYKSYIIIRFYITTTCDTT